jgi:hypothetical protein
MFFRYLRRSPPPRLPRPQPKPPGIAGEIAAIAAQTCDAITRAQLNGLVYRVARVERTAAEIGREHAEKLSFMAAANDMPT